MNEYAIKTHNLSRSFGEVQAVKDLSLEIISGSVFGFLGPNGAGKTTTIRLLLGLLEPTGGSAQVFDFDTHRHANRIRELSGALLEHHGLYERLSAEDNLEFYGRVWRFPRSERQARKKEVLTQMGLWDRRGEQVVKWSRGMKQKLAVARALFHRPALIFLDEPTAGLDPVAAASLRDDLAGLDPVAAASLRDDLAALAEREGVTVFLSTHNLTEAEKLCHRVGVIRAGRLLAVGTPAELRSMIGVNRREIYGRGLSMQLVELLRARPEVIDVRLVNQHLVLDLEGQSEMAPLVNLMLRAGVEIEEVRRSTVSLEEVFLTLVEE
jgi:ABC-2 type transport system ATP-binding protein